jgi:predicted nucleotidyltransferase component of viral defense system
MTNKPVTNIAASIRQKLLNNAKQTNRPFTEVLRYYTIERYLYRLTKSPNAGKFILKGAMLFTVWKAPMFRGTKDLDLLGQMDNSVEQIIKVAKQICRQPVETDGIEFDPDSVMGEKIIEEADYSGVRIKIKGMLGTTRLTMQMDIGFGDVIYPKPSAVIYPTILDSPAPKLQGYSRESFIAEKFHIMINRGMLNSRLKDYYDVWALVQQYDFNGKILAEAISRTFENRGTSLNASFSKDFSNDFEVGPLVILDRFVGDSTKESQWQGFLKNNRIQNAPSDLKIVGKLLTKFFEPVTYALTNKKSFNRTWKAPGPWK